MKSTELFLKTAVVNVLNSLSRQVFNCSTQRQRTDNSQKEDAHYWLYVEFASRRAHRKNVVVRRDFFLADVIRHSRHG